MLMTTKNGKAIVRVIAVAICALMLIAFGASCSDDTAARAEEAYNAALKAEEAAKEADKAAKDAQDSADEALKEAENAENTANEKLTEDEIVKLLEKYVDSDSLATELAKLLTEESIGALVKGDITKAKDAVMADVNKLLEKYGCTELADKIEDVADQVLDQYAEANTSALEALLAMIETKNAKLAEVKASVVYGDAAVVAINEAFEIAQVKILCANSAAEILAADEEFDAVLADLPSIVDELYARISALEGNVIIAVPGYYADSSEPEIEALKEIIEIVKNIPVLKEEMLNYEVEAGEEADLTKRVDALEDELDALGDALTAAQSVNSAINALLGYEDAKYNEVVNTLDAQIVAANNATNSWITTHFGTDTENANINRILYNRVAILNNYGAAAKEDFDDVKSAAEYIAYVKNLPAKYTAAINALVGANTTWNNNAGYVLAGDLKDLDDLKTKAEGENTTFEFAAEANYAAAKAVLDSAWNYAAYADYLKTEYNADDSAVKAAVEALAALNGKLTITDVNATENNKFTAYETAYAAWIGLDPVTGAAFTEVPLKPETVTDIVGADNEAAIVAVYARKTVLEAAEDAAEKINLGGVYIDEDLEIELDGKNGIDYFFTITDGVWTLRTDLTYRDIVELRRLAAERDIWVATFAIETDVADNYGMVENEKLAEATAKAKKLVDAIINAESTKALAQAVANLNKVTNDGEDYTTLYSYLAVNAAIEAYNVWDEEIVGEGDSINTTGISEFKEAGLDNIYGNLMIAHSKAKATFDAAVTDYDASLYTAFDANFTVNGYNPTVYDKFVRDAWDNAEEWAETYLVDNKFTDANNLFNVDELGLLTADVYAKVKGASEKYEAFITARIGELTALNNRVNAFKNGDAYVINIITDKADIDAIVADYATWVGANLDDQAIVANIDLRIKTENDTTATAVEDLEDKYEELYNAAWTAWETDVAAKITAIGGNYEAGLYSCVDTADALYLARAAYDAWATAHIGGAKTSAAFDEMPANDTKLAAYNTAIEAIEALEADVAELAEAYEDVRDAIIADINGKIPTTVTSNDATTVKGLVDRYNEWAADLNETFENAEAVYNTTAIKDAFATLNAANTKIGNIKTKLEAVENALAALPTETPDAYVGAADYATKAGEYTTAVVALKTAVDAYLAENSMTELAAGDDTAYELDAAQVIAIKSAYALNGSIEAIAEAHALYLEYQDELTRMGYEPEDIADRDAALLTTRNALVNNIVKDATTGEYVPTTAGKVERIGRARMAAIVNATGDFAEVEEDDTWEDLENWGPTTNP